MTVRGSVDFWLEPEQARDSYNLGRTCSVCGDPLYNWAKGRLCRDCLNRTKSLECQAFVRRIVAAARRKRVHDWCVMVGLPERRG